MWPGEKVGQGQEHNSSSCTEAAHSCGVRTGSVIRMDVLTEKAWLRVVTASGVQEQSRACFPHPTLRLRARPLPTTAIASDSTESQYSDST